MALSPAWRLPAVWLGALCWLPLLSGPDAAAAAPRWGEARVLSSGGGRQQLVLADEIISPVRWQGSAGSLYLAGEFPNDWGCLGMELAVGRSLLFLTDEERFPEPSEGWENYEREFDHLYARGTDLRVDLSRPLDAQGAWRWWLGGYLGGHLELVAHQDYQAEEYGYGSLTLGPILRCAWSPRPATECRALLAVPLCGWLNRGPWSTMDPSYDWGDAFRFEVVGAFYEWRTGLAIRQRLWGGLGLEGVLDLVYVDNELSRSLRSLTRRWQLGLAVWP